MSKPISKENLRICPICYGMYDVTEIDTPYCIKCKNNLKSEYLYLCKLIDAKTHLAMIRNGEDKAYRKIYKEVNNSAQSANLPKCPICGSTDLKKLSTLNRGASAFMWGLGSNKIGKTYECRNCKSTF